MNTRRRTLSTPLLTLTAAIALGLTAGCDIDKTQAGELPDVDVDVDADPGELPAFDVDWADVDVGTSTETVTVPKLKVVMEEETIEVPSIDVDMPDDADDAKKVRRTINVSAQVEGDDANLEIQRVYQMDNTLLVVSRLSGATKGGDKSIASDHIVINAPELDVRHVIIGQRPAGAYNEQYRYVSSLKRIDADLKRAKQIYSKS